MECLPIVLNHLAVHYCNGYTHENDAPLDSPSSSSDRDERITEHRRSVAYMFQGSRDQEGLALKKATPRNFGNDNEEKRHIDGHSSTLSSPTAHKSSLQRRASYHISISKANRGNRGHCLSKRSQNRESPMGTKSPVDSDLTPGQQDGLDGTSNAEGLLIQQAPYDYLAEVIGEQEISPDEQFRRLHDLPHRPLGGTPLNDQYMSALKSYQGNSKREQTTTDFFDILDECTFSCDSPRAGQAIKAQSEHDSDSITDRSLTLAAKLSERQIPITIEQSVEEWISDSRIHGHSFAAEAQDPVKDKNYEELLKEEMDAIQTEYDPGPDDPSLGWISTSGSKMQQSLPMSVLIPSSPNPARMPSELEKRRVARWRDSVQYIRHHVQHHKDILRMKEDEFFNENEKFLKIMREWIAGNPGPKDKLELDLETVTRLLAVAQSKADEFGPLIYKIATMEEELAAEETKLTHAEDKLHRGYGIFIDPAQQSTTPDDMKLRAETKITVNHLKGQIIDPKAKDDANAGDDSSEMSFFSESNYPSLWVEWQSRRGDEEILQERLAELWLEKEQLEDQKETRQRVGLKLQRDDEDFLGNFEKLVTAIEEELGEVQHDIQRLRDLCFQQGIIDENGELVENAKSGSEDVNGKDAGANSDDVSKVQTPSEGEIPKISNEPTSSQPEKPAPAVKITLRGGDLGQPLEEKAYQARIGPWLLEKLAASQSEVALLATIVKAVGKEPDENTVDDVLRFWENDGAGYAEPPRLSQIDDSGFWELRKVVREIREDGYDKGLVVNLFGFSLGRKRARSHQEGLDSYYWDPG